MKSLINLKKGAGPMNLNGKVIIDISVPNQVSVRGFPNNLGASMQIMDAAKQVLVNYFIRAAQEGRLDDNGNVQEALVQPAAGLILPGPGSGQA